MQENRLGLEIAQQIGALLDAVPAARRVLPHLAALEQILVSDGLEGLEGLPLPVLEKARSQLANLPNPPDSALLPQFLSLLELAVESRQRPRTTPAPEPFLPSFMDDGKLEVSEASHTDFARALEALDWNRP